MSSIIECKGLTKAFDKNIALQSVNLEIPKGKIIGLLGPNGSGKTTFIKIASGLLTPTSGSITISGKEIGVETKKIVSYLPDKDFLPNYMKVKDIIAMYEDFYSDFDKNKAYEMLKRLNLSDNEKLGSLSKGTKEKVQLIMIMSRNAELYLLDEPIGGVDPAARDYILNTIIGNYSENATVIISTHLISDVEKVLDEVVFISKGQVALHDSVDNIREQKGKSVDQLFREVYKC